ncbi:ATP-dependent DNA helicase [Thalassotalea agarivorans]|uniref:ATP-dependent DNA helicase n=1 Tax=Thalassotalea agarivorans TaxID=349064 RepID=UPI0015A6A8BF|nr:ATP-dependent DNA helicase [Thalassotalea agarivorans]
MAKHLPDFVPRHEQVAMAQAVQSAIDSHTDLIVEAGTGVGKTFAYLLPVLSSLAQNKSDGYFKKVVISTGTKALQEQLFYKDLPRLMPLFPEGITMAMLKGRNNYLCIHKFEQFEHTRGTLDAQQLNELVALKQWSVQTDTGDFAEIEQQKGDNSLQQSFTARQEYCSGKACADFERCYLKKARDKAQQADIVIVNHHLYFADIQVKQAGFSSVVDSMDLVVFDEAHQLPNVAQHAFSESISSWHMMYFGQSLLDFSQLLSADTRQLFAAANTLRLQSVELRAYFPAQGDNGLWQDEPLLSSAIDALTNLGSTLAQLKEILLLLRELNDDVAPFLSILEQLELNVGLFLTKPRKGVFSWFQCTKNHVVLRQTPLDIAHLFNDWLANIQTTNVFTSATLSVENNLNYFTRLLGLKDAKELVLNSPFDFQQQSLLYVPRHIPAIEDDRRAQAIAALLLEMTNETLGGCLALFTSYKMLYRVAEILDEQGAGFLIQGQQSKQDILTAFRQKQESILLATASFWEGVDIRGDALSCVMIDKLPFTSPADPKLQGQLLFAQSTQDNIFESLQLPQAVMALKQGAGRLIRHELDRGLLIVCDDRLVTKPYGQSFLASLPNMRRTRCLDKAKQFISRVDVKEKDIEPISN